MRQIIDAILNHADIALVALALAGVAFVVVRSNRWEKRRHK